MPTSLAILEEIYNNAILSEDINLQPSLEEGQDLYYKRKATCQTTLSAAQENITAQANIFPAGATSTMLYKHLTNLGLPPSHGALPSYGNIYLIDNNGGLTAPANITIIAGSILTNSNTGVQYQVTITTTISTGTLYTDVPIPIQSILSGTKTYSAPNTTLLLTTPLVISTANILNARIISIVSGEDAPTDLNTSNVIYNYMQNPRGGGSVGDYYRWALLSDIAITDAKIIATGGLASNANFIIVAIMGGSNDPNVNIALNYPISRGLPLNIIDNCGDFIEGKRPVNDNPNIITVSTFALSPTAPNYVTGTGLLNPTIDLTVALADGINLDTLITGSNGITQSVEDWIKYQFRFAVLSVPYGGIIYDNQPVMLGENITTLISNGLASLPNLTGYLCSILVSINLLYSDNNVSNQINIPVPNSEQYYIVGNPTTLNIIYDIDVNILNITVI